VALERAGRKLAAGKLRGDEAWLVFQAAAILGGEFPAWAEGLRVKKTARIPDKPGKWNLNRRVYRIRSHEFDNIEMPDDPGELPPPDTDPRITDHELTRLNRVMDWSMRCRDLDEPQLARLRWELEHPSKSYVLAHQLWAGVTSISFGCVDREWGTKATVELARHVLAELLTDEETSDLSVERMAFLCYANAYHWIPDEKFEQLVRDQKESGSWGTLDLHVNPVTWVGPEHTMALAFYALAHRWVRISGRERATAARGR